MSEPVIPLKKLNIDPALALLEFNSIAAGILSADAMVKRATLDVIHAGTVQPGRFLILVGGAVAEVEEALKAGQETAPDGSRDENVFDIQQGVSINIFIKTGKKKKDELAKVFQTNMYGLRNDKYKALKDNNLSSNPDIKHYLFHDVFTYISSLPDKSANVDTAQYRIHELKIKDTLFYSKGFMILNDILKNPDFVNNDEYFRSIEVALIPRHKSSKKS